MKYTYLFAISLFLISCGPKLPNPMIQEEIDVSQIIAKFESFYGGPIHVVVGFGKTDPGASAQALCSGSKYIPSILVRKWSWNILSETSRESILFHELAHCFLGRMDLPWNNSECPPTLMATPLLSDSCYLSNERYYMQELFN